jgi:hypothetical protein
MFMAVGNTSLRAQVFSPEYTEPYPPVEGAFFIRTYLVYVQTESDTWADNLGQTELLDRRSRKTMEMLNAVFNPYQIYFISAPPPNLSGDCYTVYTGTSYPVYADGLTIQILSDDYSTTGTGQAGNGILPATY